MKFVYLGYDFMLPGVQRLLQDGHELTGIFTFECDNVFNFNEEIVALGKKRNVPVFQGKPDTAHIDKFTASGTEVFIAAGYPYKIPPIDEKKAFSLNMHPSLLPLGRGIMPTPYIIMDHPEAAGISVHKITDQFDDGDILYQESFDLTPQETVETYAARIVMKGPHILSTLMMDLPRFWNHAKPQDRSRATYFPPPDDSMRTLDWNQSLEELDKTTRAFGRFGSLAYLQGELYVVYDLSMWPEDHNFKPGEIVCVLSRELVVAVQGGFACLKEFHKISQPQS